MLIIFSSYYLNRWEKKEQEQMVRQQGGTSSTPETTMTPQQPHFIDFLSYLTVALLFVIALLNIFIASFGVQQDN